MSADGRWSATEQETTTADPCRSVDLQRHCRCRTGGGRQGRSHRRLVAPTTAWPPRRSVEGGLGGRSLVLVTAVTWVPRALASWTAKLPTPPEAPTIRVRWPGSGPYSLLRCRSPVDVECGDEVGGNLGDRCSVAHLPVEARH